MRHETPPVAERAVARHCRELLRPGRDEGRSGETLALFCRSSAGGIASGLAALAGGSEPVAAPCAQEDGIAFTLLPSGDKGEVHRLLKGAGECKVLVSLSRGALLEMVDRTFGGDGAAMKVAMEQLPPSAELVLKSIGAIIAAQFARFAPETGLASLSDNGGATDCAILRPFPANADLCRIAIEIAFDGKPFPLTLTLGAPALSALSRAVEETPPPREDRPPAERQFAEIPLRITATLVDMRIPLSRLAGMKPGDILPISVARNVPVTVGGKLLANGIVGEMDDRVALSLDRPVAPRAAARPALPQQRT